MRFQIWFGVMSTTYRLMIDPLCFPILDAAHASHALRIRLDCCRLAIGLRSSALGKFPAYKGSSTTQDNNVQSRARMGGKRKMRR